MHFRPALTSDAAAVAALHADSWRRYYRGAYADAYLDGDIDADRLAVWSARLAAADPRRVTIVAEAAPDAQASVGPAPVGLGSATIVAATDPVPSVRGSLPEARVGHVVAGADDRLPEASSGRVVVGDSDPARPAASVVGVAGADLVAVARDRLPQVGAGTAGVGPTDPVAVAGDRLPAVGVGTVVENTNVAAASDHHLPRAGDGGVPTGGETPGPMAAAYYHPPPSGMGGPTTSGDDRLVAITGDTAWRTGAADESDTRHMAVTASALVGFVHLVVDDDARWGSLIDNLHVVTGRHRGGVGSGLIMWAAAVAAERGATPALYLWVQEQNTAAQAFYAAHGGQVVERALISAPGGIPGRLNGNPGKLRVAWPDARAIARPR
ncbi:MAG TPA: GNAT family N-acetyltransferase [Asanoa sp.]|nr:GNAT family N-acetyltransferase [Asanoa sp.]